VLMLLSCILAVPMFAQTVTPTSPDPAISGTQRVTQFAPTNVSRSDAPNPTQLTAEDETAFIRFAHVALDAPPVDLYITEIGDTPLIENLAYGAVTDFIYLPEGNYTLIAREVNSSMDGDPLAILNWDFAQDTSSLVSLAGLLSNVSLQIEPIVLLRNDIANDTARVRVINFVSGAEPLTITSEDGDDFGQALGWLGVFDTDVTAGMYNLNITTSDGSSLTKNSSIELPAGQLSTLLVLGSPDSVEVLPFHSVADAARVQLINNTSDTIDIFRRPDNERVVASLAAGETSEWIAMPSGSTTFIAFAPETGPTGQELAAWIGEVKTVRDTTITFQADGSFEQTEVQFTPSIMPNVAG
jgi:hypothetical protein